MPTPIVIDLSHHNTIPSSLKPAADQGIIGVIHKATEGTSFKDSKVAARKYLADDAGMLFGIYHFIRPGKIREQADNFLEVWHNLGEANMLLALDYEDSAVSLEDCIEWLDYVENVTGQRPVIYSGHVLKEKLRGVIHDVLNGANYLLWLAQYNSIFELPPGWSKYFLWQYTDKGEVAGVNPPTDLNTGDSTFVSANWFSKQENNVPTPPEIETDIGGARAWLFEGRRVARKGWNGKNMYLELQRPDANSKMTLPYVYMKTAQGDLVPWLCSQTDFCATDWVLAD